MRRMIFIAALTAVVMWGQTQPQRSRTRSIPNTIGDTGAYHEPAATMHGAVKRITNKAIVIVGDGDQEVEIVRTRKTKFLRAGKEIKPAEIAMGSILSIDVGKFPDLTPQAVNVMVEGPPVDGAAAPAKPANAGSQMDQEEPVTAAPAPSPKPAPVP